MRVARRWGGGEGLAARLRRLPPRARAGVAPVLLLLLLGVGCQPRVLLVGLDGASYRVLDPLFEAGHLPTLERLVREGARADLDCVPALPEFACFCPPVWASLTTGVPASQHRILNFYTSSRQRSAPSLWDLLAARGGRSTLVAYRGTWPPDPSADVVLTEPGALVAGELLFQVSGASKHPGRDDFTTWAKPVDLLWRIGMLPPPSATPTHAWAPFAEDRVSMEVLSRLARARRELPPWERATELDVILLHSPDRSMHMSWGTVQPTPGAPLDVDRLLADAEAWTGPVSNPPPFAWSDVPDQLMEADRWLGRHLAIEAYDYVVLTSDHGMARRSNEGLPGAHGSNHPEAHVGIFAVHGPGVAPGADLGTVSVLDVAPTVAYLLGMPVADDLPGRLLVEAFTEERLELLPPERVASWSP